MALILYVIKNVDKVKLSPEQQLEYELLPSYKIWIRIVSHPNMGILDALTIASPRCKEVVLNAIDFCLWRDGERRNHESHLGN